MILFVSAVILVISYYKLLRNFYFYHKKPFDKHTMEIRNEYGVIMFDSWEDHIKYKKWSIKMEIYEKLLGVFFVITFGGWFLCAAFQAAGVRPN